MAKGDVTITMSEKTFKRVFGETPEANDEGTNDTLVVELVKAFEHANSLRRARENGRMLGKTEGCWMALLS